MAAATSTLGKPHSRGTRRKWGNFVAPCPQLQPLPDAAFSERLPGKRRSLGRGNHNNKHNPTTRFQRVSPGRNEVWAAETTSAIDIQRSGHQSVSHHGGTRES